MTKHVVQGRRHWHDILRDLCISLACVIAATAVAVGYVQSRQIENKTLSKVNQATSQKTAAKQAQAGGILVECGTLKAFTVFYHVSHPEVGFTFPATKDCAAIVVTPEPKAK